MNEKREVVKTMDPRSARALVVVAFLMLLAGASVGAPPATVAASLLAVALAIVPAIRAKRGARIGAILVVVIAAWLAVTQLQSAKNDMDNYRNRAESAQSGVDNR